MLKRKPSLTDQARAYIKQCILNDEFEDGRIPAEMELAERLGVSRTTIRDALARLEQESVIYRKQGAGTFVNKAGLQIQTRLEAMWGYETVLEDHGYTAATHVLAVQTIPADEKMAADLELAPGAEVLRVKKLFLADDEPVILAYNHIPAALLPAPPGPGAFMQPIYRFMWEHCRQHLTHYLSEIVPAVASVEVAEALHLRVERPLISFHETGFNDDAQPILKAYSYFRDDLLRFRLIRREVV